MLNGETLPECKICDPNDKKSITAGSYKDMWNESYKDYIKTILENTTPDGETSLSPTSFHYELSNLCNFACRMCSVEWASKIEAEAKKHENYPLKRYERRYLKADHQNMIKPWQKRLEDELWKSVKDKTLTNIYFAGGEPLMDPLHYKVLEALEPFGKNISVKYSTNLSKLVFGKFDTLASWSKFREVDLSLSIDGYPQLNNYIRTESDTDVLAQNLREVKSALGNKYKGRAALCYSAWNVFGLPECYEYFDKVLQIPVHGNIAWEPKFINPQILPAELKQKATIKYKNYLKTVALKDVDNRRLQLNKRIHRFVNQNMNFMNDKDLSKYFQQFLRFSKTLDDSRNTSLVEVIPEFKDYV